MVFIPGPRFARAGRINGGGGHPSHPLWTAHYLMPSSPIGPASSSKPRPGYKYHVFPSLFILHTLYPALEDGTDRGFRNVGKLQSDAGEIPKSIHTIFKTRRKSEIKNIYMCMCVWWKGRWSERRGWGRTRARMCVCVCTRACVWTQPSPYKLITKIRRLKKEKKRLQPRTNLNTVLNLK